MSHVSSERGKQVQYQPLTVLELQVLHVLELVTKVAPGREATLCATVVLLLLCVPAAHLAPFPARARLTLLPLTTAPAAP